MQCVGARVEARKEEKGGEKRDIKCTNSIFTSLDSRVHLLQSFRQNITIPTLSTKTIAFSS